MKSYEITLANMQLTIIIWWWILIMPQKDLYKGLHEHSLCQIGTERKKIYRYHNWTDSVPAWGPVPITNMPSKHNKVFLWKSNSFYTV